MWVVVTPADVGGDPRDALELAVPGPVDRVGREREGRGGQVEVAVRVSRRELPVLDGDVGQREQLGGKELPGRKEARQPVREVRVEERRSSGTSIEVNTRNGFAASSSRSSGRNAVETTGIGAGAASRRS